MTQKHSRRMRRLLASDLLPQRAGQPVKALVHISFADLCQLDADSDVQDKWIEQYRGPVGGGAGSRLGQHRGWRGLAGGGQGPGHSVRRDAYPGRDRRC